MRDHEFRAFFSVRMIALFLFIPITPQYPFYSQVPEVSNAVLHAAPAPSPFAYAAPGKRKGARTLPRRAPRLLLLLGSRFVC